MSAGECAKCATCGEWQDEGFNEAPACLPGNGARYLNPATADVGFNEAPACLPGNAAERRSNSIERNHGLQ